MQRALFFPEAKIAERELAVSALDSAAVRSQLERILLDSQFKNSRRYPKLLRFVVEHTLDSPASDLKERTLGVDVFGRSPDYDTGLDPIVRITAGEIRKRLAHYYAAAEHGSELRISLPVGSYVPEFFPPPNTAPAEPLTAQPLARPDSATAAREVNRLFRYFAVAFALLTPVAFAWWALHRPSPLESFWNPVLGKSGSVLLCVGQREDNTPNTGPTASPSSGVTLAQLYYLQSQNVAMPDVVALAQFSGLLRSRHLRYQVRGASQTTLSDLRESPVILVGAFTNDWNLRLNRPLRFSFERKNSLYRIRDAQHPEQNTWLIDDSLPYMTLTTDYALITRVIDPASQRLVVSAGGLSGYGTQAAGEFLTEPAFMQKLTAIAPPNWEQKNLQIVISTRVINGSSGPPEIVSSVFW